MGPTPVRPLIGGYDRDDFPSYDSAPDGRFLIIRGQVEAAAGTAPSRIVVPNWFEELKRLVPTK